MKKILLSLLIFTSVSAIAQTTPLSGFGLGALIGDPTALSFKGHLGSSRFFDAALAYNTGPADEIYIHGDYLIERQNHFQIEGESFNLYYGIGGRLYIADTKKNNDEVHFGPRVPVGIAYNFKDPDVELFGELAAVVEIVPETDVDVDFSLGARYWF